MFLTVGDIAPLGAMSHLKETVGQKEAVRGAGLERGVKMAVGEKGRFRGRKILLQRGVLNVKNN